MRILNFDVGDPAEPIEQGPARGDLSVLEKISSSKDLRLTRKEAPLEVPGDEVNQTGFNVDSHHEAVLGLRKSGDPVRKVVMGSVRFGRKSGNTDGPTVAKRRGGTKAVLLLDKVSVNIGVSEVYDHARSDPFHHSDRREDTFTVGKGIELHDVRKLC